MAKCYQCGNSDAQLGLLCENCVALNRSRRATLQSSHQILDSSTSPSPGYTLDLRTISYIGIGLAIVILLVRSLGVFGYGALPEISPTSGRDSCLNKHRCLVVVLAPWCPACKASVPFLRAVNAYTSTHPELGVQVYVGLDNQSNLSSFANKLNLNAIIDQDNQIYEALGGGGVPRWGVIDQKRQILNRGGGLAAGLTEHHPRFVEYLTTQLELL